MPALVVVTADSTREDLVQALANLCGEAKAEARRGYAGINGSRYAALHDNMSVILTEIEMRDALGLS